MRSGRKNARGAGRTKESTNKGATKWCAPPLTMKAPYKPMTIRGGGNPHTAMAAMPLGEWTRRLGALLAEAYDCFMVGTLHGSTEYKRGWRAIARGQWQAPPRIIAWQTTRSRAGCRRARVGQGQAFGGAEEAPSLTLAARDGDGQYAVGAEECSRRGSNKRINKQGRDKMVCTTLDKESKPCARI